MSCSPLFLPRSIRPEERLVLSRGTEPNRRRGVWAVGLLDGPDQEADCSWKGAVESQLSPGRWGEGTARVLRGLTGVFDRERRYGTDPAPDSRLSGKDAPRSRRG